MFRILTSVISFFLAIIAFFWFSKPIPDSELSNIEATYSVNENRIEFLLPANSTTGFSWECSTHGDAVKQTDAFYVRNDAPEYYVGVGGVQHYTYEAVHEGLAVITFIYSRNGIPSNSNRVITATIHISADCKITVDSFTEQ